jgi:hypothetical protein
MNCFCHCPHNNSAAKASKQESMGDSEEFTEAVARADYIYASSTARAIFAVSFMSAISHISVCSAYASITAHYSAPVYITEQSLTHVC